MSGATKQSTLAESVHELIDVSEDELPATLRDVRKVLPTISDAESHYHLPIHNTTWRPKVQMNQPCGLVVCLHCGEGALNCDDIEHLDDCDQSDYRSAYWWAQHEEKMVEWFEDHPEAAKRWLDRRRRKR